MDDSRGERIRTSDLLNPIQTRYQAAPRPVPLILPNSLPIVQCSAGARRLARWLNLSILGECAGEDWSAADSGVESNDRGRTGDDCGTLAVNMTMSRET